ncbi:hypothetical protein [Massilia sp. GCM10023247]|uniref:hypothetical protein n=1 Tax=Massilia sp. GCM10023247 TaxID=3252643 RepID=UPI0036069A2C
MGFGMTRFTYAIGIAVVFAIAWVFTLKERDMQEITFDIGKNIQKTAQSSVSHQYSAQEVDGLLLYDIDGIPPDVLVRYARADFDIVVSPIFSLTLYADRRNNNDLAVQTAALQASTRKITSHAAAQEFVASIIDQFQKGKWRRHIDDMCPAVTGRSSILDENGRVAQIGACPLDPEYRLSNTEWEHLMSSVQNYQWIGGDVMAKLTIGYSDFGRGLKYSIDLEFDDYQLKRRRDNASLLQRLEEGDAMGWNSSKEEQENVIARKKEILTLERNAIQRGDKVLSRN